MSTSRLWRKEIESVLQDCRTSPKCPLGSSGSPCTRFDIFALKRIMVVFGQFKAFLSKDCFQAICYSNNSDAGTIKTLDLAAVNKSLSSQPQVLVRKLETWLTALTKDSSDPAVLRKLFIALVCSADGMRGDRFPQGIRDLQRREYWRGTTPPTDIEGRLEELEKLRIVRRDPESGWWEPTVLAHRFARRWIEQHSGHSSNS